MSRRLPLAVLLALVFAAPVLGQRGSGPLRETSEPPLADDPDWQAKIQQAANREPRPLSPSVRNVDVPAPAVVLTVRAPASAPLGQDVEVRLIVENVSRVTARNVMVIYPLPQGASATKPATPAAAGQQGADIFWKFDTLAAGARQEVVLTVKPPDGATEFDAKARVVVEQEQSAKTRLAKTELKLAKTGPKQAQRFDILVFGLAVMNPSSIELTNVTVSDKLPAGFVHRPDDDRDGARTVTDNGQTRTWKIDRIGPRETRHIQYNVAATSAPAGKAQFQAFAQATGGAQASATDEVELVEPKLEVKVDAPPHKAATLPATVRITLTNRGPRLLQNIVVTDALDPCKVQRVGNGGQQVNNSVQWIVPSLPPNQPQALEVVVAKPDGGPVRHKVSAVYRGLNEPAEGVTEFDAVAALSWDFKGGPATVEVGGEVVYELGVRNTGSAPATNVRATIRLPEELTLVTAEPENKADGGVVTFEPTTLLPNKPATFRVRAKAAKPALAARVTAELSGDPFPTGPVTRQEMTAIGASPPAAAPPAPAPPRAPLPVPVPPPPAP
jgi:uncharacterized repeat protein (TIGR01451 family)